MLSNTTDLFTAHWELQCPLFHIIGRISNCHFFFIFDKAHWFLKFHESVRSGDDEDTKGFLATHLTSYLLIPWKLDGVAWIDGDLVPHVGTAESIKCRKILSLW